MMGEIDRTAAAKRFQDALQQFQESLEPPEALDTVFPDTAFPDTAFPDTAFSSQEIPDTTPSTASTENTTLPLETKLLRRLRSPQREQQLAAMEAAIADLEAFLGTNPSPQINPESEV